MPYFRIEHENKKLHSIWSDECLSRGIYLTSYHNHFLSIAQGEEEVDLIIKIASEAFDAVAKLWHFFITKLSVKKFTVRQ